MKSNTEQLAIAKKYVGYGGSKFRKFCGLPSGAAWCDAYVTTIFAEAGNASLFCNGTKQTYCPTTIKWCLKNLAEVPPYLALPSDIGFCDWELNGIPNHIVFIRERKDCEAIYTIEGNTSGGIVANKVRNTKYVCGIFRPHFKATFDASKPLVIDGYFGYNSIAMLQKALGVGVDGILGQGTVKALQRLCGASADGLWGKATSKKLQKYLKVTADGEFGPASVKALQKWINTVTKSSPSKVVTKTWQDKANEWARDIAKQKYHYVRWGRNAKSHTCPICNGREYDDYYGWNCIGFAFNVWRHGGKLGTKCNCGVIDNAGFNKLLTLPQAKANKYASDRIGKPVEVIRNGGKPIPLKMIKAGDLGALYRGKEYYHLTYLMGGDKYAESNTTGGIGSSKNIRADIVMSKTFKANLKLIIRYAGK